MPFKLVIQSIGWVVLRGGGGEVRGAHLTFVLWRACLLNPPWQFVSDAIGNLILRGRSWEEGFGGGAVSKSNCLR